MTWTGLSGKFWNDDQRKGHKSRGCGSAYGISLVLYDLSVARESHTVRAFIFEVGAQKGGTKR